tara:strand:- start:234 stop:368 length:135 start_codon:yes stop_codon:yes gene_type:complete
LWFSVAQAETKERTLSPDLYSWTYDTHLDEIELARLIISKQVKR